jgi:hypothetical protein
MHFHLINERMVEERLVGHEIHLKKAPSRITG